MTQPKNRQARVLAVLFGILLLAGGIGLIATASAQEVGVTQNETETPTGERIDGNTVIVDSRYNAETGRATLTIRSEELQQITLSDAGAFIQGGEISQNSVLVKAGTTQEISVSATQVRGFVGVSVATDQTLWAEKITDIEVNRPPVAYEQVQLLVLLTAVGAAGMTFGVIRRRYQDEEKEAERLL